MIFEVFFESKDSEYYPISLKGFDFGTEKAHELLSHFDLDVSKIKIVKGTVMNYQMNVLANVTYGLALQVNHFDECNRITVVVPGKSLERYTYLKPGYQRAAENAGGEILSVWYEYEVDRDRILADWIDDGSPLQWDPELDYGDTKGAGPVQEYTLRMSGNKIKDGLAYKYFRKSVTGGMWGAMKVFSDLLRVKGLSWDDVSGLYLSEGTGGLE